MDSKKSNKIIEIVRLQRILKKWKKVANTPKEDNNNNRSSSNLSSGTSNKSMKFLKKTLSFSDRNSSSNLSSADMVAPKGHVVISVGEEEKRFIIKTEHLGHQAFEMLLSEAEEEYGFQQEGVLKLLCQVSFFEKILKIVEEKISDSDSFMFFNGVFGESIPTGSYYSPDRDGDHDITHYSHHQFQICT